ncbi:iron chelate uptake ABC transporter family permease subunit [Actinomadura sp. KC216]|uniref:FecCD family ABC transporter permease n=1 Tax=Actinomadura sp. KC216 TaxID=2530370 RepID=UPI001FB62DF6|nr:iron chelate uptake ABC transporter family permease subunit [Actinomadura sp. KC216]
MSAIGTAVVLRRGRFSALVERRTLVFTCVLLTLMLALGLTALSYGAGWSSPAQVLDALRGERGGLNVMIREWRLPRVLAAVVFGAALGVAGAIFQNVTRNALGSPDVIGLDAGAYTGTLVALTLLSAAPAQQTAGSVVGALAAAALVYVLAMRGGVSGLRLIVVGIAVNAMITAVNSWIVLRAELEVAIAAVGWSAGSLNGLDWDHVRVPFWVIGVLLAVLVTRAPAMHQAALGTEVAVGTGVRTGSLQLQLVLIGVGCTATVTAVTGPIAFVALAAPQIGRRIARTPGVGLLPAALTGALLLQSADLIAQLLLSPVSLPVGVVTTAIGGCYLIWLLTKEVRSG